MWVGYLEESILVYLYDHGGRRRAVRGCLRAVRGDWQVSIVIKHLGGLLVSDYFGCFTAFSPVATHSAAANATLNLAGHCTYG